jgi:hypothetical protein
MLDLNTVESISSLDLAFEAVGTFQKVYSSENTEEMKARGKLVRKIIPRIISNTIFNELQRSIQDLRITGSDGVGRKAEVAWVRLHSKSLSPRATSGWYVVYLFDARGEEFYLSLNQGSTQLIENSFVPRPKNEIAERVNWARKTLNLSKLNEERISESIDLKAYSSNLGPSYEVSNIYSISYSYDKCPSQKVLLEDLKIFVNLLSELYQKQENGFYVPGDIAPEVKEAYDSANIASGKKSKASSGQGFKLNQEEKELIEEFAMERAKLFFERNEWEVKDVSATKPYDFVCTKDTEKIYLEVKGTTGDNKSIIMTRNEVNFVRDHYPNTALFLVSLIQLIVNDEGVKECVSGVERLISPWNISESNLKVISYQCFLE